MQLKLKTAALCIAALVGTSGGWTGLPAQDVPGVEASAQPSRVTVGDLLTVRLTVRGAGGGEVDFAPPGESLGPFEVRGFRLLDPGEEPESGARSAELTLSIFQTGEFQVPPLEVVWRPADGGPRRTLQVPQVTVVVESVKPAGETDIRDIKPPLQIPRSWWALWRWALAAAALAAVASWFFRRRKPTAEPEPIRPMMSPYAEAYQALCRLRDEGFPDAGRAKAYYTALSNVTRRYLQRQYGVQAPEMTTAEIAGEARRIGVEEGARLLLEGLLRRCDLVKFAKHNPSHAQTTDALAAAFRFLEQTRPRPSDAASDAAAEELKTRHV